MNINCKVCDRAVKRGDATFVTQRDAVCSGWCLDVHNSWHRMRQAAKEFNADSEDQL